MKRRLYSALLILLTVALAFLAYTYWPDGDLNWALTSLFLLLLGLGLFYLRYERAAVTSKETAVIASLAAVAIVGRILFAPFPNFKPTTYIVLLAGYVFGPRAGFMVGATAALVSNLFFGQGPWTPWQMLAWGLVGVTAGWLGRVRGERVTAWELAGFGLIWGFLFGWIMNLWTWLSTMYPLNFTTWWLTNVRSLPFDIAHAAANVLFALLLTKTFLPILLRFRRKLTTTTLEVLTDEKR
ncbi:ECF transporter S component [Tumebacillus sp. DT12]|uniref:ECF transporter S component n=1 Tax=Tumebacillus lacus TaxID=2995335 RepID=A0ABT3X756_9BACL|nr:ECF transporter S component [Tumebacillus lacus]MCX7570574.1 ECF transporter S component [Tumebacillus lacus]